ncbi:unnamed protein product [Pleuronectes platessa]|uniref:Uncharacterized protein n=1 Tax=Pleuronectes platessa TaxID=8262 RepID=A0A9N7Z0E7_PLEPL|nr:unnamed protein product [Pleuronectes platessa]
MSCRVELECAAERAAVRFQRTRGERGSLTPDYNVEKSRQTSACESSLSFWVNSHHSACDETQLMSAGPGSGFAGCHCFTADGNPPAPPHKDSMVHKVLQNSAMHFFARSALF